MGFDTSRDLDTSHGLRHITWLQRIIYIYIVSPHFEIIYFLPDQLYSWQNKSFKRDIFINNRYENNTLHYINSRDRISCYSNQNEDTHGTYELHNAIVTDITLHWRTCIYTSVMYI